MPAPILQFKRGNAGVAGTVPALRPGEPAISLNNFDFFVGSDNTVTNNKFFGSHRYWGRENGTTSLVFKLVDRNGANSINLKSPNTLAGITTYTFPETPINAYVLTTNATGDLSWTNTLPASSFSGITTFTDSTNNTLGNADTGSVQVDGGLGVNRNVTVGGNLNVQGYSEFVGVVTFRGGTINIGDSNTDNINIAGEFISNLNPNDDNTYDIGIGTQRWRNANFAGVGTFATGAVIDSIQIGIAAATEIDTTSGNLTIDSAGGTVTIDDELIVTNDIRINGNDIRDSGGNAALTFDGSQNVTANSNLTVSGNLYVNGSTTQVNTTELTVEDRTIDLGIVNGSVPSSATTWDLGVLFNYHAGGSAKKSAVVWEHVDSRFKFASVLSADTNGTTVDTPQLTVTTFAPIEVAELWVNNTCTGNTSTQVIACSGSDLILQNITIDAGTF